MPPARQSTDSSTSSSGDLIKRLSQISPGKRAPPAPSIAAPSSSLDTRLSGDWDNLLSGRIHCIVLDEENNAMGVEVDGFGEEALELEDDSAIEGSGKKDE
eukprot:7385011-Prymnesium_polylepis.1